MKRKEEEAKKGAPEWMVSYGDMMTSLFTFFVLMFAMSTLDESRLEEFLAAFGNPFISPPQVTSSMSFDSLVGTGLIQMPMATIAGDPVVDSPNEYDNINLAIQSMTLDFITYFTESQNPMAAEVNVELIDDQIVITFASEMLFASGDATLMPATLDMLDYIASVMEQYADFQVRVLGHTDSIPINTARFPSNWELGFARARSVQQHLTTGTLLDESRVIPMSFADTHPVASNDTAEGRAQNRRVEIVIEAIED